MKRRFVFPLLIWCVVFAVALDYFCGKVSM